LGGFWSSLLFSIGEGRIHPPCMSPINAPISSTRNQHLLSHGLTFLPPRTAHETADRVAALLHSRHKTLVARQQLVNLISAALLGASPIYSTRGVTWNCSILSSNNPSHLDPLLFCNGSICRLDLQARSAGRSAGLQVGIAPSLQADMDDYGDVHLPYHVQLRKIGMLTAPPPTKDLPLQ